MRPGMYPSVEADGGIFAYAGSNGACPPEPASQPRNRAIALAPLREYSSGSEAGRYTEQRRSVQARSNMFIANRNNTPQPMLAGFHRRNPIRTR